MKVWPEPKVTGAARIIVRTMMPILIAVAIAGSSSPSWAQESSTKPTLFVDDFNRPKLGDNYEVIDPDFNRLTVTGGKLIIVGTNPANNRVLLRERFEGDFVATVEVAMEVTQNNYSGLVYYVDSNNLLQVGIAGAPNYYAPLSSSIDARFAWGDRRQPYFVKIVDGQDNNIVDRIQVLGDRKLAGYSPNIETWYLQLRREGSRYTGLVSADGVRWTRIGSHVIVQPSGQIGFRVASGGGVENAAEFDNFSVQQ